MVPKFRAWYTPFGGSVKQFNKMKHGSAGSLLTHAEMSPDDYKIMQSTGLKDKNGVEIFEGDIVAIKYSESGYHYYEKIVFENGTYLAEDEDWLYNIKDYCVVCGNIYEDKELLEVEG